MQASTARPAGPDAGATARTSIRKSGSTSMSAGLNTSPTAGIPSRPQSKPRASTQGPVLAFLSSSQISFPLSLVSVLLVVHFTMPYKHITSKFLFLSHQVEHSGMYVKGPDDMYFVLFWIVAFTFIRAVVMEYILIPVARYHGVTSKKVLTRFAEQSWGTTYYCVFWLLGMNLYYNSPYWRNTDGLWLGWPHRELAPLFKCYYLLQLAFWLQQIYVINIEERRKDYHQMLTHHIVTCILLIASYNYCFTRIGHTILVLMDVVDIFLCTAKSLRYLGYQLICDILFGLFVVTWILTKHILYTKLVLSATYDSHRIIGYKCYFDPLDDVISVGGIVPGKNNSQGLGEEQCFTELMQYSFISLLWVLQGIALVWLFMIVKVVRRVLTGNGADDSRSENEEEEDEEEIDHIETIDVASTDDVEHDSIADSGCSVESVGDDVKI